MALKILLTNDDGIEAEGLRLLYEVAKQYGEVTVVAPRYNQSAKSQSIIIHGDFFVGKSDLYPNAYMIESTPADCVRYAYYGLNLDFDIVLSGINNGYNLGEDIAYSGTVAAAMEGAMCGKKAIAFSCGYKKWGGALYLKETMDYIINNLLDKADLLNVNLPENAKGFKLTKQGSLHYYTTFVASDGGVYQQGTPDFKKEKDVMLSDVASIHDHYISITPLTTDKTDFNILNKLLK